MSNGMVDAFYKIANGRGVGGRFRNRPIDRIRSIAPIDQWYCKCMVPIPVRLPWFGCYQCDRCGKGFKTAGDQEERAQ